MVKLSGSISNWLEHHSTEWDDSTFNSCPRPAIWVLNPFRLARLTLGRNAIEDLSLRPDLDYFESFHLRHSWPFIHAIPVTLPWRQPRMVAQRGYFTVHGLDTSGIEIQFNRHFDSRDTRDTLGAKIELSDGAAIAGVRHVVQFVGLDSFSVFRDEDNLGSVLQEFMRRPTPSSG